MKSILLNHIKNIEQTVRENNESAKILNAKLEIVQNEIAENEKSLTIEYRKFCDFLDVSYIKQRVKITDSLLSNELGQEYGVIVGIYLQDLERPTHFIIGKDSDVDPMSIDDVIYLPLDSAIEIY